MTNGYSIGATTPDRLTLAAAAVVIVLGGGNAIGIRFVVRELDPFWGAAIRNRRRRLGRRTSDDRTDLSLPRRIRHFAAIQITSYERITPISEGALYRHFFPGSTWIEGRRRLKALPHL